MNIQIAGPRVALRTLTREKYHAVRRIYVADPHTGAPPYRYDAEKADAAFDAILAHADDSPVCGIFLANGTVIGELAFKRLDLQKGRCELGITLANDSLKEKGYGGEAFRLAVDYALGTLGLDAVYANTMGGNARMQRVLDRLGFRCYLRMQDCYEVNGRREDRLDYVLRRGDWRQAGA